MIENYSFLKISFYNIRWLYSLKNGHNFLVPSSLLFTITLLLPGLIRVFSSKNLFMTSDTLATRNDLSNVHVLYICDHWNLPIGSMLDVSICVVKNSVSGLFCHIMFKPGISSKNRNLFYELQFSWCKKIKKYQNFFTAGGQSSPFLCSSIKKSCSFNFLILALIFIKM